MRNTSKLYYPFLESIQSVLPIVDEFIIAMGDNDIDDTTLIDLERLNNPKIKIITSPWDTATFSQNTEYARQTDIAMKACQGDWLLYLQSDEVIHEQDHLLIIENCKRYLNFPEVEGFLLQYLHFWGDYHHVQKSHGWYPKEIRIIRNQSDTHSWRDAQSFRKIYDFKGSPNDYLKKDNTKKLQVMEINARVFHYGHVRPPDIMYRKQFLMDQTNEGLPPSDYSKMDPSKLLDYGPLDRVPLYKGSHPKVMQSKIAQMDWDPLLQKSGPINKQRPLHKHEKTRNRFISFFEKIFGQQIGGFKNYKLLKPD